jgi:enediyne polyketide synthase
MRVASAPGKGALAGFTLAVRATVPVACAWLTVDEAGRQHRPAASLVTAYGQLRAEFAESPDVVTARLESLRACLAMADPPGKEQMALVRTTSDGWAVLETGRLRIASVVVDVSGVAAPVAIALLTMRTAHARPPARLAPAAP